LNSDVFSPTQFGIGLGKVLANKFRPDQKVCELGIGTGILSILAGLKGARIVGLDKNPAAVKLSKENAILNGLPLGKAEFLISDLFSSLDKHKYNNFDIIWANPSLLPETPPAASQKLHCERYEVSGPLGRRVLDCMLTSTRKFLKPDGKMYTIATSLQGWDATKKLLDENWSKWKIVTEFELELTSECGPEYIKWWKQRQRQVNEQFLFGSEERPTHKIWFIEATNV
jgi:methylase of polypeptide subunit release factors